MTQNFVLFGAFCSLLLCFCHSDRHFEVDTLNSGFRYPTKSKEYRHDVPSLAFCALYGAQDNVKSFSYNPLNETRMTYSGPICAADHHTAETDREEMMYGSEAVGSCEETPCSGKYNMRLCKAEVKVKCEHDSQGNKWTVIQERKKVSDFSFDRTWNAYKYGFGDLDKEFWIGNDALHCLTQNGGHQLQIQFVTTTGAKYANYKTFVVDSESNQYKGSFGAFTGTAEDRLSTNDGGKFSTKDHDNDMVSSITCAATYKGGWWYYFQNGIHCGTNYLNAMRGIFWGSISSTIETTKMMIKKKAA